MREYFYLNDLKNSPYDLTMADSLHLGAVASLPVYFFLAHSAVIEDVETGESHSDEHFYVRIPDLLLAALEKEVQSSAASSFPLEGKTLQKAFIDHKYAGSLCDEMPFKDYASVRYVYLYTSQWTCLSTATASGSQHPVVKPEDLICWTEDLDRLVRHGHIHLRGASNKEPQLASNERQDYPSDLDILITAWRRFWKNASRNDRTTCPKKDDVKTWLMEQGLSAKSADAGATIIKPDWASEKHW